MNENKKSTTGLKVISVFLAVLLWLFVTNQNIIITKKQVNGVALNHINLSEGLKAYHTSRVSVEIIGTPKKASDIDAYVDLKGLAPGVYKLPVKVRPVKGARVISIRPEEVSVQVFETKENIFPVSYRVKKSPPPGYRVEGIVAVPDKCVVKGPEAVVERVSSLKTFLDLKGRTDSFWFYAPVVAVDARGKVLSGNLDLIPGRVKIFVVIGKERNVNEVPVVANLTGKPPDGYTLGQVKVDPAVVSLLGDPAVMKQLTQLSTGPVNLQGRNTSFTEEVTVAAPRGVTVYPGRVRVYVEITPAAPEVGL